MVGGWSAGVSLLFILCFFAVPIVVNATRQKELDSLFWLLLVPFLTLLAIPLVQQACWGLVNFIMTWRNDLSESRYFSALASTKFPTKDSDQSPPSFTFFIDLSIASGHQSTRQLIEGLESAIERYRTLGGSANILIFDNRIPLLPRPARNSVQWFYRDHSISWLACTNDSQNTNETILMRKSTQPSNINKVLDMVSPFAKSANNLTELHSLAMKKLEESVEFENICGFVASESNQKSPDGSWTSFSSLQPLSQWIVVLDCNTKIDPNLLLHAAAEIQSCPSVEFFYYASLPYVVKGTMVERMLACNDMLHGSHQDCIYAAAGWSINPWSCRGLAVISSLAMETYLSVHEDGQSLWPTASDQVRREFAWQYKLGGGMSKIIRQTMNGPLSAQGQMKSLYDYIANRRIACDSAVQAIFQLRSEKGVFSTLCRRISSSDLSILEKLDPYISLARYVAGAAIFWLFLCNYLIAEPLTNTLMEVAVATWFVWVGVTFRR